MVERYAHLAPNHLAQAASRLDGVLGGYATIKEKAQPFDWALYSVAPRPGLEPGTCRLTVEIQAFVAKPASTQISIKSYT